MDLTEQFGFKHIRYEKKGMIAYVSMNREKVLNTYTNGTLFEMQKAWQDYDKDDNLRAAILYGQGKHFCAGHDLTAKESLASEPPAIHYGDLEIFKPIIGAVGGYALGGGCSMALACDILIMGDDAKIGYPQAKVGIISIGGPQRLPRLIPGLAKWYLFTGEFITAEEAYRHGLAFKVVPANQLLEEATKLAEKLCESSPASIRTLKESIERGSLLPLGEAFKLSKQIAARFEATPGYQEAMKAFLEKKDPPHRVKK